MTPHLCQHPHFCVRLFVHMCESEGVTMTCMPSYVRNNNVFDWITSVQRRTPLVKCWLRARDLQMYYFNLLTVSVTSLVTTISL